MHLGSGHAAATAAACEDCLSKSPPFDDELLALIEAYAKSSRRLEAQFRSAIEDERGELNAEEADIASECGRNDFFLLNEILQRIDYDSLVTVD